MAAKKRAGAKASTITIDESPLEDYLFEVEIIAQLVMAQGGTSRDRGTIQMAVAHHVEIHEKPLSPEKKLPLNRKQQVCRGLTIGVTKVLEAWEWVSLNRAWPPEEGR